MKRIRLWAAAAVALALVCGALAGCGKPVSVDFECSVTSGPAPLEVKFLDRTPGDIIAWAWDFGDDSRTVDRNPTHVYSEPGTYTVTLSVSGLNKKGMIQKQGLITVEDPLQEGLSVTFDADRKIGNPRLVVQFQAEAAVTMGAQEDFQWNWDFGDGQTSDAQNPVHTYERVGLYPVTLTVTRANGKAVTERKTDFIQVLPRSITWTLFEISATADANSPAFFAPSDPVPSAILPSDGDEDGPMVRLISEGVTVRERIGSAHRITAVFGYENRSDSEITIDLGDYNRYLDGPDSSLVPSVTVFRPGRHSAQNIVDFVGRSITWKIQASGSDPSEAKIEVPVIVPVLNGIVDHGQGHYTAVFGYRCINKANKPFPYPAEVLGNCNTLSAFNGSQPFTFVGGTYDDVFRVDFYSGAE